MVKWAGLVVLLLILAAFLFSAQGTASWSSPSARYKVSLGSGSICFFWHPKEFGIEEHGPHRNVPGWFVANYGSDGIPLTWWVEHWPNNKNWNGISIPLRMPFLMVAIPTALLWWRDRHRIPSGHCQNCGYDLTGNLSGICPECGVKVDAQSIPKG